MPITVDGPETVVVVQSTPGQTIVVEDAQEPHAVTVGAVDEPTIVQMTAAGQILVMQSTPGSVLVATAATPPVDVVTISTQGPPGIAEDEVPYAKRVDFIGETDAYVGEANPGTAEATAAWRIKKLTFVGDDVETRWAAGAAQFVHAWTDRLTLTYS